MPLGEGAPHEQGGERRALPLKRHYFTVIGLSNMKMVEDRHRRTAYHNKHWWRAF